MIWNLLDAAAETKPNGDTMGQQVMMYVILAAIVVVFAVWMFISGKKNKQRQQEYTEQLDAIRPGHKVKTAGGICGIVKEVCDDNTVILETGNETTGKSFIKMDKDSIVQTDAKGPTQIAREEAEAAKAAKSGKAPAEAESKQEPVAEESAQEKGENN